MSDAQLGIENVSPAWVGEVLRFWFEETAGADWFKKSDEVDARIRARFRTLYERLAAQDGDLAATGAPARLATVIVLDQFSRSLFRGDPRAFAADPLACRLSRAAITCGLDTGMTKHERLFLYLPFEHSEDAVDQELSVNLISALGDEALTRWAVAHKVIIDRFGRFPHRNAVLGRRSTTDEIAFLRRPMSAF